MIEWDVVITNGLWILGLSIVLAAFSYHEWLAGELRRPRWGLFRERSFHLPWASGMLLTCLGVGLSHSDRWWARGLWFVLAVACGCAIVGLLIAAGQRPKPASS